MTTKINWDMTYVDTSALAEERAKLSESEFNVLLYGEFVPDERENAVYDRLTQYYKDTPNSMDNRVAMIHWKLFKQWCNEHGITRDEINRAKKQCAHLAI